MLLSIVLAGLLAPTVGARAQATPNDGWVTDRADLLTDAQEQGLEALMESYKQGSSHEIALLTVPELGGRSIEELALETAREWGLGAQGKNNGALLVIALKDREMRIEVGRGLEGELTDSICGRIIRDVIAPEFKRQRYYEGIHAGIVAMHRAAGGDYGAIRSSRGSRSGQGGISACFGFLFFLFILASIFSRGRGGRSGGLGSWLPWWLLIAATSNRGSSRGTWASGMGGSGGFGGGGGFSGFGGGGGFSGGGASGGW